jgi:hypothetical protein
VARENQGDIVAPVKGIKQGQNIVTWKRSDKLNSLCPENIDNGICNTHVCSHLFG